MTERRFKDFRLIGGHPALDLVNTLRFRGRDDPGEALARFADLVGWSVSSGLLTDEEARPLRDLPASAALETVRAGVCLFREDLRRLIVGKTESADGFEAAAQRVEEAIGSLRPAVRYDQRSREITVRFPADRPEDLPARIVNAAAELLKQRNGLRIRECAGENCDWLFIDGTKAGRRLWCHSETCGNLSRVRRHRGGRLRSDQPPEGR